MSRVIKTILLSSLLLLCSAVVFGQKVSFEIGAPAVVEAGEVFRVEFSLNAIPDDFTPPTMNGLDVLAGPTTSQGKSISIVNGSMTTSVNFTYTYVLQGANPGRYTISGAQCVVDGKSYSTQATVIEIVGDQANAQGHQQQRQTSPKGGEIASDDLFVRTVVNRNSVYKGQPIKVSFKLYTRNIDLSGAESIKLPAFNGFWTQEINTSNYRAQRETYNSKVYNTQVVREYLIFPQQAGVLNIEQFDMTVLAQIVTQARRQSIIDDFFGGANVQNVRKRLTTPPVKITVKDLPAGAPESFSGAVGDFTMTSDVPSSSVAANSSSTYVVKISGSGNLPLIQAPKLTLPTSFEQYNIKTTESLNNNAGTISGYRQFDYPFIARAQGSYEIEPIVFTYFNPDVVRYITLSTKNLQLNVMPDSTGGSASGGGMVSGLTKEDIKILGQDIRFIKIGSSNFTHKDSIFMGSWLYFVLLLLVVGVFVAGLFYLQKRIKEMRNSVLVRGKRANKVALQRLKLAEGYMRENDQRRFYEEMLRALWGYMSDKLNIPVANLTKENVREELLKREITHEQSSRFIELISECEYAQYSPAGAGQMHDIYAGAVENISKFESLIKK